MFKSRLKQLLLLDITIVVVVVIFVFNRQMTKRVCRLQRKRDNSILWTPFC